MEDTKILHDRIQKLESLLESSKLLSSTQDTSDILQALLTESITNIKDGDTGIIFLYNEKLDCLEVKAFIGFGPEMGNLRMKPDESITGTTFTSRKPLRLNSAGEIAAYTRTMSLESQATLDRIFTETFPLFHSSISCPLIFRDHCFGVIVIDGFKEDAKLTEDDLAFLESISIQAAIAINNSLSLERESKTAYDLEKTNRVIETQKDAYKFTLDLHTKFTNMILHGCDVADILRELTELIACDTLVISPLYAIIGHQLNPSHSLKKIEEAQTAWFENLSPLQETMIPLLDQGIQIRFLPILINLENYGWLGIMSPPREETERHSIAIERSLANLALILLKTQEVHATELRLKGEFFETLLADRDKDFIDRTLKSYGYRSNHKHILLIISLEPVELASQKIHATNYLRDLQEQIKSALLPISPQILTFMKGTELIFLMEDHGFFADQIQADRLWTLLSKDPVLWRLLKKEWRIKAGVSNAFVNIEDFKTAYLHANYALEIGNRQSTDDFLMGYSQLKVKRFLLNNDPDELQAFAKEILGPLIQYDQKSNAHFLETLEIYIRTNNSWTQTKDQLFIHGNTLTYRLHRIEEILGIQLDHYQDRLNIQIAFEILELKNL